MSAQVGSSTISNYLYKLVPFASLAPGAYASNHAKNNKTFNTNVPFGMAMVVRRIRWQWFAVNSTLDTAHIGSVLAVAELTENLGLTDPLATDALSLWDTADDMLAGSPSNSWMKFMATLEFLPPHPGQPTIAQQLNVAISNDSTGSNITNQYSFFMEIFYELVVLNQQLKDWLANRIAVQRTS